MKRPSHRLTWTIAVPLGVLMAALWTLPFVAEVLHRLSEPGQALASFPTQMPPSESAVLLEAESSCRMLPQDSAATVTTIGAGTQLPIVAQYQRWYLVQVELSVSQYNRCWINPSASTVTGAAASIPRIGNPTIVPLYPGPQMVGVPDTGGQADMPATSEPTATASLVIKLTPAVTMPVVPTATATKLIIIPVPTVRKAAHRTPVATDVIVPPAITTTVPKVKATDTPPWIIIWPTVPILPTQ